MNGASGESCDQDGNCNCGASPCPDDKLCNHGICQGTNFYKDIIEALQQGLSSRVYIMIGGLLHYIDEGTKRSEPLVRACIPRVLVGGLLDSYHKWYSHPSADKTYYSIRKKYYWPNMYSDCHHFTQKCRKCRAVNAKQTIAPLGRPEIPTEAGLDLSIDFVGPLIISLKGNKYFAVKEIKRDKQTNFVSVKNIILER